MDLTLGSSVVASSTPAAAAGGGMTEALLCALVAMVVLRVEVQRRAGAPAGAWPGALSADRAKQLLKEHGAEAALLLSVATLALLLRSRGDVSTEPSDVQWEQIKSSWPLLLTADSLLALQVMLRLALFMSALLRWDSASSSAPLAEEATALLLFASLASLGVSYRTDSYFLDGPLGGYWPVACEVAVVPTLLLLSRGALRRSWLPLTAAACAVAGYGWANRLALAEADDSTSDWLFAASQGFELLAAFVYLGRAALVEGAARAPGVGFAHLVLPLQQALGAYYWLEAFAASPEIVGAGRPFDLLHGGTAAALGAYLAAAALFAAERLDGERPVAV